MLYGSSDVFFSRYLATAKRGQDGSCTKPLRGVPLDAPLQPIVEGDIVLSEFASDDGKLTLLYTLDSNDGVQEIEYELTEDVDVTRQELVLLVAAEYRDNMAGFGDVTSVSLIKLEWRRANTWQVIVESTIG
jgi:hypothetical protein